jgi:hypothetical protein
MPDPRNVSTEEADRRLKITAASGAHATFLAAQHDPMLKGSFTISHRNRMYHNGELVDSTMLSKFLVFLTGKYGIRPTLAEVEAGFKASARQNPRSIMRKRTRVTHVSPRLLHEVDRFIRFSKGEITTKKAARKLIPDEYETNPRTVEMKIAEAFKMLGYRRTRRMINCIRRYRWEPDPNAPAVGLNQDEKNEFEKPTTTSDDYTEVKTQSE